MKKSYRFVLFACFAVALCLSAAAAFAAAPPPPGRGHHYERKLDPKPEPTHGPHHAPKPEPPHVSHHDPSPRPKPGRYYDPHYRPAPHNPPPPPPPYYGPEPEPERGASLSPGVWVMPEGKGFHRFGCKFIRGRRGLFNMTAEEALRRGYRPCRTCFPDAYRR